MQPSLVSERQLRFNTKTFRLIDFFIKLDVECPRSKFERKDGQIAETVIARFDILGAASQF